MGIGIYGMGDKEIQEVLRNSCSPEVIGLWFEKGREYSGERMIVSE